MEIKRFQVYLINLDPTIGHEIKKTRPCLIVSPNENKISNHQNTHRQAVDFDTLMQTAIQKHKRQEDDSPLLTHR